MIQQLLTAEEDWDDDEENENGNDGRCDGDHNADDSVTVVMMK